MHSDRPGRIVCLGGAALDRTYRTRAPIRAGTSNPAAAGTSFGGVARNVAETLARLGNEVALVSRVGDDAAGAALAAALSVLGVDVAGIDTVAGATTAEYLAVLDADGSLVVADANCAGALSANFPLKSLKNNGVAQALPPAARGCSRSWAD